MTRRKTVVLMRGEAKLRYLKFGPFAGPEPQLRLTLHTAPHARLAVDLSTFGP
jgi:hypothetical protein